MNKFLYRLVAYLSVIIGTIAFIVFFSFVFIGPLRLTNFNLGNKGIVLVDAALSLVFFFQHSLMIREVIRKRIIKAIPDTSYHAFFSITSGIALIFVVVLWQESSYVIFSIDAPYAHMLRLLSLAAAIGLIWAIKSLSRFDPFGEREIINYIDDRQDEESVFVSRGPFKLVRHPFYFFILVMIWASPILTVDRLVFATLWTIWMVAGTFLEERDLVIQIGQEYREYKKRVPMLIPYKIFSKL